MWWFGTWCSAALYNTTIDERSLDNIDIGTSNHKRYNALFIIIVERPRTNVAIAFEREYMREYRRVAQCTISTDTHRNVVRCEMYANNLVSVAFDAFRSTFANATSRYSHNKYRCDDYDDK